MSYFNDDQRDHMRSLAAQDPADLCWSGWCQRRYINEDGVRTDCCAPQPCPIDVTLADRRAQSCDLCGNFPDAFTGRMTHNAACTVGRRRDHHAAHELGGEA